jgi:hypothetical protein
LKCLRYCEAESFIKVLSKYRDSIAPRIGGWGLPPIVLTIDGKDAVVVEDAIAFQEMLDRLTAAEEELEKY